MKRSTSAATAAACLAAYGVLGAAFNGRPPRHEQRAFQRLNHGVGPQPWLRIPQQLGTPWTLPAVGAIAAMRGARARAAAALLALPLEKALEVGSKHLLDRPRPAQVLTPHLRDDAPEHGPSFPSGHAAIAACSVWMLVDVAPDPLVLALAGCAALTAATRVHQGAHHPTDALAGVVLGVAVGALLTAVLGDPASS